MGEKIRPHSMRIVMQCRDAGCRDGNKGKKKEREKLMVTAIRSDQIRCKPRQIATEEINASSNEAERIE